MSAQERDVRCQLVSAASELLGEMPPPELTVRRIAARAGVQHSLITRHFGSRATLLQVALASLLDGLADALRRSEDIHDAIDVLLDEVLGSPALRSLTVLVVQENASTVEHPVVDAIERHLLDSGVDPALGRDTATILTMTTFAWAAAEPWWLDIMDRSGEPGAGRGVLRRSLMALVTDATHDTGGS